MSKPAESREGQPGILVVDDERPIVDLLTRYLSQHGFRAIGAYAADEARRKAEADPGIGVVISDVRMPGQSGLALAEELTRSRPEQLAIEIVLISGAGIEPGPGGPRPFDVLRKPFRPSEVVSVASRALAASRERRDRAAAAAVPPPSADSIPLAPATLMALRTPLLPILNAAQALATGAAVDVAQARDQALRIRDGALELLALIDAAEADAANPAPLAQAAGGRR
jgi:CheY-like chemotaxis protein